ncbi:MAG: cytochrome c [Gemmatimonadales bacterium]
MNRAAFILLVSVCCAAGARPARAQSTDTSAMKSILDGAYTTAQARRGEAVFNGVCGDCHALAQFRQPSLIHAWDGRTVRDLFESIRTQMPLDDPGVLRREQYADVLAYVFELSGLPPGDTALPTDDAALRRIRIERKAAAP